jgi:hypothetical protein
MCSEAGFSPLIQVFLSRFYAREKLGVRVAVWLAMAPLGWDKIILLAQSLADNV